MELSLGVPIPREGPVTSQRPSGIGRKEQSEVRGVENKERATETGQVRKGKGMVSSWGEARSKGSGHQLSVVAQSDAKRWQRGVPGDPSGNPACATRGSGAPSRSAGFRSAAWRTRRALLAGAPLPRLSQEGRKSKHGAVERKRERGREGARPGRGLCICLHLLQLLTSDYPLLTLPASWVHVGGTLSLFPQPQNFAASGGRGEGISY